MQQYGADLTVTNSLGNSPLIAAIEQEYKEIFEALLQIASYSETQLEQALSKALPQSYFQRRLLQTLGREIPPAPTTIAHNRAIPATASSNAEPMTANPQASEVNVTPAPVKQAKLEVSNAAANRDKIPTLFDLKTKVHSFFKLIATDPTITVEQLNSVRVLIDQLIEKLDNFSFFRNQATKAEFEEGVQEYIDETVEEINGIIEDDYPALTEALVDSVWTILQYFRVEIDIETALRKRFW